MFTICLLMARRLRCGGELGGPSRMKWASAGVMLALWLIYVVFSIVQAISEVEE